VLTEVCCYDEERHGTRLARAIEPGSRRFFIRRNHGLVNPHPLRPLQRRLENRGLLRGKLVFAVLISDFVRRIVEKTQIFSLR